MMNYFYCKKCLILFLKMSGISLFMKLKLEKEDFETFEKIKSLMIECEDVDHKKTKENQSSNTKEKNEQNENNKINDNNIDSIDNLLNEGFDEYINSVHNRGPDSIKILSIKSDNSIENCSEKLKNMKYKDVFDYLQKNNEKIIIDSFLNLYNANEKFEDRPYYDIETKNIFQFNGEIYENKNKLDDEKDENNKIANENRNNILFNILNKFSKENKIDNHKEYVENFFKIYNNIESDHSFYFHDNINNQILISRDVFGKRSIILCYIKSLSILILTPVLTETLIKLSKSDTNNIYIRNSK